MDWYLIISLATLVLVIFTIVWGTGLWTNREKITLTYPRMQVKLETDKATGIDFECQFRLTYEKGTRDYYISKIFIEFDKRPWKKLSPSFEIPLSICKGNNHDARTRLSVGRPREFGHDASFPARRTMSEEEQKELNGLVQKLWHRYKIGWQDTYGKTRWRTVNQFRAMRKEDVM